MGRNEILDKIKGLAILLVVLGHCCLPHIATQFIYSFHMPVFFLVAGYLFKSSASESLVGMRDFVARRIKRLYVPFAFWCVVLILLHNCMVHVGLYSSSADFIDEMVGKSWESSTTQLIKDGVCDVWTPKYVLRKVALALLFLSNPGVGFDGTFWFLKVLFFASLFYCIVDYVFKKCRVHPIYGQSALIVALLVACRFVSIPWSHAFLGGVPLESYAFYHIGVMLRHFGIEDNKAVRNISPLFSLIALFVAILAFNAFVPQDGYFSYAIHRGITALMGLGFLTSFAALSKGCMGWILVYLGKRTQPIMIFHFAAFRVVTLAGMLIGVNEEGGLAAFPIGYEGFGFTVLYFLAGVGIPLVVYEGCSKVLRVMPIVMKRS